MEHTAVLERIAPLREAAMDAPGAEYALNVVVVYEDAPTRQWSEQLCERVASLAGQEAVRATWWKLGDLSEPGVLAGAVSKAIRSDVIVVALRAAEMCSLPFYVWVDSWLPHHQQSASALVALIAMPEQPPAYLDRLRDYLRAVARRGRLDFMIEERKLPAPAHVQTPMPAPQPKPAKARFRLLEASTRAKAGLNSRCSMSSPAAEAAFGLSNCSLRRWQMET